MRRTIGITARSSHARRWPSYAKGIRSLLDSVGACFGDSSLFSFSCRLFWVPLALLPFAWHAFAGRWAAAPSYVSGRRSSFGDSTVFASVTSTGDSTFDVLVRFRALRLRMTSCHHGLSFSRHPIARRCALSQAVVARGGIVPKIATAIVAVARCAVGCARSCAPLGIQPKRPAGHRAPPGLAPLVSAQVKPSGAVVPTACKCVLMVSRLAVGFSWNINRGFAATGQSIASVTSLVAATKSHDRIRSHTCRSTGQKLACLSFSQTHASTLVICRD